MPATLLAKWRSLLQIFHDEEERPYGDQLTEHQIQIIDIIAKRRFPRTQLILPTQYGKSLAVALGVLMRTTHHREKWAIVAPTEEKARIIMDYIIEHIFDDPIFQERLEYYDTKEKLKQQRSRTRLTFRDAGEIRVYSADARNTQNTKRALMGFGAPNVILDESALVPDDLYATVKRMLGGTKDNFLLEIGNPFFRNHFHRTWYGNRYRKVYVDVEIALAEGRYASDYIDEMRDEAFFDVLYECKFPDAEEVLANGYRRLVSDLSIDDNMIDAAPELIFRRDQQGEPVKNRWGYDVVDDPVMLGIDVAATGTNKTKFVLRFPKHGFAMVAGTSSSDDLEEIADQAEQIIRQWTIGDYRIVVDAGGVGHGLPAILRKRGYLIKAVMFGDKAPEAAFANIRAWMYWEARKWLKSEGGKLKRDDGFLELKLIHYKQNSSLKLQIEPKEDMIRRKAADGERIESPDTADAFILTFVGTGLIVEEEDIVF